MHLRTNKKKKKKTLTGLCKVASRFQFDSWSELIKKISRVCGQNSRCAIPSYFLLDDFETSERNERENSGAAKILREMQSG
jgi:hypothetical protein